MKIKIIAYCCLLCVIFSLAAKAIRAQDKTCPEVTVKTIRIEPGGEPNPPEVSALPGTVIIWINHAPVPKEILFSDKDLSFSCGTLVTFFFNDNEFFESYKIRKGGNASFCFVQKGHFEYYVKSSTFYLEKNERAKKGTVIIQ